MIGAASSWAQAVTLTAMVANTILRCLCALSLLITASVSAFMASPGLVGVGRNCAVSSVTGGFSGSCKGVSIELQRGQGRGPRRDGVVMMGRRAAKIAKVKGREDMKRGKIYGRIGKKLIMAVKAGGGPNEESNKLLADTIKEAKLNNVPKDNITRAIKRAVDGSQGDFKEAVYEAYGHGGTGVVVTALTDNMNRAVADVKTVWRKHGMKQAAQGSVLFQFAKKGRIEVQGQVDEESVIEAAIDAGVEDVDVREGDDEETTWILTDPKDLTHLTEALHSSGIEGESSLALVPLAMTDVDDEAMELNLAGVTALLELEDVDSVEHNMA